MSTTPTENLPAAAAKTAAARDPEIDRIARLGRWLAAAENNGKAPSQADEMAAALRFYYAAELGLPPMAAAELSFIRGRLFVHAKLLRGLAQRFGYTVERVDSTATSCTAVVKLGDRELGRYTFTIEDAKRAGLIRSGSGWESHPARMLWARAAKFALDDYAPEVTLGLATDDEAPEYLGETVPVPVDGAAVDDAEWQETGVDAGFSTRVAGDAVPPPAAAEPTGSEPDRTGSGPDQEPPASASDLPQPRVTDAQRRMLHALFGEKGITERAERLSYCSAVIGREVPTSTDLTVNEAHQIIDHVQRFDRNNPQTYPLPEGF